MRLDCFAFTLLLPNSVKASVVSIYELKKLELYNTPVVEQYCPIDSYSQFSPCSGPYANVEIMSALDRSDMEQPWFREYDIILGNQKVIDKGPFPLYAPHIFAIKNTYLNVQGVIFDQENWYSDGTAVKI